MFEGEVVILILQWIFNYYIKYNDSYINNLIFFINFFCEYKIISWEIKIKKKNKQTNYTRLLGVLMFKDTIVNIKDLRSIIIN
jgi:hypothetical protein